MGCRRYFTLKLSLVTAPMAPVGIGEPLLQLPIAG
jgi:hypothetical protein